MKKDTILHTITKLLVRNWRTSVRSAAYSSALTSAQSVIRILSSMITGYKSEITARRQRAYGSYLTTLRLVVTLLLMMIVGVSEVMAQTDYSGTYYIASGNTAGKNGISDIKYDSETPSNNYYLCPTDEENWICYVDPDNYTDPAADNDQPFLTTFKYRSLGKDATKAQWIFKKVPNSDYYHIIHKNTSRYLTYNGQIATTSGRGVNRLRFHLQSTATDNSLFRIDQDGDVPAAINIVAVAAVGTYYYNDGGLKNCIYLNLSSKDVNSLVGTGDKTDGPTNNPNVGATIGIWYDSGRSSEWFLEEVVQRPNINSSSSNQITISHSEENSTIYYTTNGTSPTTTNYAGTGTAPLQVDMPGSAANIKAIAITSDHLPSCIAEIRVVPSASITLASSTLTYNGEEQSPTVSIVKDGETEIPSSEYNVSYSNNTNAGNTATVTITDNTGGDYIVYGTTTFTINPKDITVTADAGQTKVYGATDPTLTATIAGRVSEEDAINYTVSRAEGEIVGDYTITPSGETLQGNYSVSYIPATFTITQKSLTITANSDSKEYNGTALTNDGYTNTALVTGDVLISVTVTGSQTDRGESDNVPSAAVIKNNNGNGDDVTACYNITYVNGKLWVTGRLITITAGSAEKVYDGTALTNNDYTYEGTLYSGDEITSVTVTGSQTVAGSSENVPSAAVIKNGETDKTANYDFTYVNGTLTVTPKPLTITANSDSKVYNSTALTNDGYTSTTLATGDAITSVTVTGSQTDVGTSDNVPSGAVIKNGSNEDVASSYNITYTKGTLEVTAKAVTITANDNSKEYDGTALTEAGFTASALETGDTHSFTVVMTTGSTITNAGNQPNVIATVDGVEVTTGTETAVGNYTVTTVNGTLTITGAPVTVTAGNKEKGFGDADPDLTWTASGLIDPDTEDILSVSVSRAEGEDVGGYTITPSGAVEQGNYTVTYVPGILTITAKAIGNGTTPADGIDIDIAYNGSAYTVTVKQGDNTLATTNYTWSGADDLDHPENYVVTVEGQGNYTNSAKATYTKVDFYDTTPDVPSQTETAAVYYATENLQVSNEFDAYYVTNLENNTLTIAKVEVDSKSYIPANQPVILLSKPDATSKPWGFTLKPYTGTTTTIAGNILHRSAGGETVDWAQYYIFSFGEFVLSMGEKTMAAGKFYLNNPNYSNPSSARQVLRIMRRGATSIDNDEITDIDSQSKDSWYTIDGRRLSSKPTKKGLYIRRSDGSKNGSVTVIK